MYVCICMHVCIYSSSLLFFLCGLFKISLLKINPKVHDVIICLKRDLKTMFIETWSIDKVLYMESFHSKLC